MNSPNPNSLKYRFTKGLLKALARINKHQPRSSSSSSREIQRRYRRIKTAAYASMACAVGTRRAWSRELLWKIRNQARNGGVLRRIGRSTTSTHYPMKKRSQKKPVVEGFRGESMSCGRLYRAVKTWILGACWRRQPIT
ncbi:unnamed protein product [Prunus armeniaca]